MTKKKQSVIEGGLILTLALIIIKLLGWFYRVQLTGVVEPDGYGFYTASYSFYNLIYSITVMGFPVAMSKIVSQYFTQGRYRDIRNVVKVAARFFAITGIAGTLILIILARPYANTLEDGEFIYWGIIAVAPSIFFCCLMAVYRGFNQGMSDMVPTAVSQVIEVLVKVAAGFGGAVLVKSLLIAEYEASRTVFGMAMESAQRADAHILSFSAAGAMLGITVSTVIGYIYLRFRYWRRGDGLTKAQINASVEPYSDKRILKQLIMFALPIALSTATVSFTGIIDNGTIPNIIASLMDNPETMQALVNTNGEIIMQLVDNKEIERLPMALYGVYNMELTISVLISTFTSSFGMSALPLVSAAWADKNRTETKKNVSVALRITMLIAAPIGFGLCFLGGPISQFVYGSNSPISAIVGGRMLQMLGIAGILTALSAMICSLLQGIGKQWATLILTAIGLVFKAVSNYTLIAVPQYNINAAPVGSILCYLFITVAGLVLLVRTTGIRISAWRVIIKPTMAGAAAGAAGFLVYDVLESAVSGNTVRLMCAIIAAAVVYIMALGVLKAIEREDVLSLPGGKKLAGILEKVHIIR